MRRAMLRCLLAFAAATPGAARAAAADLVVGSKNFAESRLLAEIMAQLIESETSLSVERRENLGGTMMCFSALRSGEIDLLPEYTGTGYAVILGETEPFRDPLRVYLHVAHRFQRAFDLVWLDPFGFDNSYALAIREDVAERLRLRRISDLAPVAADLRAGVSHEFLNRPDGFSALCEAYGLRFGEARGMEHGLAFQAIEDGAIDLTDAYTTDGKLLRYPVRLLDDDLGFFPPYQCAPVIRGEALRRHPELADALSPLAFRLPDLRMQQLNHQVEVEGGSFADVARSFLRSEGLIGAGARTRSAEPARAGLLEFVRSRLWITARLASWHLFLSLCAVVLAALVAVPLGIHLTRNAALAGPVLGAAGVIQTIPSLALLAFMIPIPFLGLGARSALAALFLYAVLPILRNTWTGIRSVDPALIDAARGIGLTRGQILRLVELPLALPTIFAGVRTSAVISIGVATIAAFVGAGGLGDPILTGLQLNDARLVLSGAIPAAALALLLDFALARAEKAVSPRARRS